VLRWRSPYVNLPQRRRSALLTKDEEIKNHLLSNNPDFRRLAEEHQSYEERLSELNGRAHVTGQDQLEEVDIKKKKLRLKDQMNRMIQGYRQTQTALQ
jgi:uncharacterized protein YdcH (DUF465 family)